MFVLTKKPTRRSVSVSLAKEKDGTSGRALWDRPSAATLSWRFAELQAQKNRLKGRFQYLLLLRRDGPSGRT